MDMSINKKYMIFNLTVTNTKDNRPYLRMVLSDIDGSMINGIMFDSNKLKFTPEKGYIVNVSGTLQSYNGVAQLKVSDMKHLVDEPVDDFLPKSDKNADNMAEELKKVLNKHIKSNYFKLLYDKFINDQDIFPSFIKQPAAKNVHHAYIHGLLEHTLSMVKLSSIVADYYGKEVNKELLMMGALFHDLGKIKEINSDNAFDYTDEGKLLGHLILGMEMVNDYIRNIDNFPKKAKELLLHMIAGHHGLLEYGSPVVPKIKEAILLHYIDNIDAKMSSFDLAFDKEAVEDGGWSSYDRLLERQLYRHGLKPE